LAQPWQRLVMDTELNARGIVIGERYRVAGALRRVGMIEAIDLDADRDAAACRIVGIPGDAAAVDAWEDAWREAEVAARLPRLLEVITDEDGAAWAALAAAEATAAALPPDARRQAYAIGMALATAGLDVADLSPVMFATDHGGRLVVDGVPFLGGAGPTRAAAERLVALLPPDQEPEAEPDWDQPPVRRVGPQRGSARPRRRLLVPGAIGMVVVAALLILLVPARSAGTPNVGPTIEAPAADVLLGDAAHPVVVAEPVETVTVTESAQLVEANVESRPAETSESVVSAPAVTSAVADLPIAEVPSVPLAAGGGGSEAGVLLPVASSIPDVPLGG
jgi:hypothetical protein